MLVWLNSGGLFQTFYLNREFLNSKNHEVQHVHVDACCAWGRGPNYFEVDIDVGSSKSAASVVGLVQGALKGLVIDMAITMEGHSKVALAPCCLPHGTPGAEQVFDAASFTQTACTEDYCGM